MNENGSMYFWLSPQLINCLKRIKKCGLVGGSLSLGVGFKVSKAHSRPSSSLFLYLLPMDQDVKLSAVAPEPWLSVFCHDDNGLSESVSKTSIKDFLLYE